MAGSQVLVDLTKGFSRAEGVLDNVDAACSRTEGIPVLEILYLRIGPVRTWIKFFRMYISAYFYRSPKCKK